jgi:hypothetical protein
MQMESVIKLSENVIITCEIWGHNGGEDSSRGLMGSDAV